MPSLILADRDDRLPVIFAIRETARRYCDLEVRVVQMRNYVNTALHALAWLSSARRLCRGGEKR